MTDLFTILVRDNGTLGGPCIGTKNNAAIVNSAYDGGTCACCGRMWEPFPRQEVISRASSDLHNPKSDRYSHRISFEKSKPAPLNTVMMEGVERRVSVRVTLSAYTACLSSALSETVVRKF